MQHARLAEEERTPGEAKLETYFMTPSPLSVLPHVIVLFLLLPVVVLLSEKYPASVQIIEVIKIFGMPFHVGVPLFGLLPLLLASYIIRNLYNSKYMIGTEHVRAVHGLFSFRKQDRRIDYADIRSIEVVRGLFGRLLNIGNVIVRSTATLNPELVISHVSDPSFFRDVLLKRKELFAGVKSKRARD